MPAAVLGAVALGGASIAAGGVGAALAAGGFTAIAANFGVSMLLSAGVEAIFGGASVSGTSASRDVAINEPISPRRIIYGEARVGGTIVFKGTTGQHPGQNGTVLLHLVIVLAGHQIEAIDEVYFGDELAFDSTGTPVGRYVGKAAMQKRLGTPGQTAIQDVINFFPGKWTSSHRLDGCAVLYVRLFADSDTYPTGMPQISAKVRGKNNILDPRNGQRGYTTNAALCQADYLADTTYGLAAPIGSATGVNTQALIEAANICDEAVELATGGYEDRYTCNGVIDTSQTPQSIIGALLTASHGQAIYRGGGWIIRAGAYRTPGLELTDDDASDTLTLTTRLSRASNFNGVRGTFVSPTNDWQPDDFPAYASDVYLAEDNGERVWRDLTLPFTISPSMAQRIAKIELETARRQLSVNFPAHLSALRTAVGETVTLSMPRWGFSAKPFDVAGFTFNPADDGVGLTPVLALSETSPLVYDWSKSEEQIYAAAPRTDLPSAFSIQPPGAPSVDEEVYVTRAGNGVKSRAIVSWVAVSDTGISAYQLDGSLDGGAYMPLASGPATSAILDDIAPGVWTFRLRAISTLNVKSDWVYKTQELYGLTAAPSLLSNVTLQAIGGLAILKWAITRDIDVRIGGSILIRHSANDGAWESSVQMDAVQGGQGIAVVPLKPGTYLLRAQDSSGALGPITAKLASGAQVIQFANLDMLQEDSAFTGSKSGVIMDGSTIMLDRDIKIDDVTNFDAIPNVDALGGIIASGTYTFSASSDLGAVRAVRLRSEIVTAAIDIYDNIDARSGSVDDWESWDGATGGEVDVIVEVRTTNDDPAGTPAWSDWGRIDSSELSCRAIEARALLTSNDPSFTPAVSILRLHIDEVS